MRTIIGAGFAWTLLALSLAAADEEASPAQKEYDALVKAQRDAQSEFSRAYQAAKTKEEKDAAVKQFGNSSPQKHADGFAALVEKYPNDLVTLQALEWIMQRDPGGRAATRAVGSLGDELLKSPKMADLCRTLGMRPGANSENLLQVLIARSPHREVQAYASFARCQTLKSLLDRSLGNRNAMEESRERLEKQL